MENFKDFSEEVLNYHDWILLTNLPASVCKLETIFSLNGKELCTTFSPLCHVCYKETIKPSLSLLPNQKPQEFPGVCLSLSSFIAGAPPDGSAYTEQSSQSQISCAQITSQSQKEKRKRKSWLLFAPAPGSSTQESRQHSSFAELPQ